MSKKISLNKGQLIIMLIVAAIVVARNLITLFSKGKPGEEILIYCIGMSLLYAYHFFSRISLNRADMFKGENIIGIISAVVIFVFAFTRHYITHDFCLAMFSLFAMLICAADIRLMPINAVLSLAVTVLGPETTAFSSIPFAAAVSFGVVLPSLKGAELWKKLVFAATQICSVAMLVFNIYQLRFNFSFQTAKSYLLSTVIMAVFAALLIALAVLSLKKRKASPARKKKKAVEEIKPCYAEAFGYVFAAAFAMLCTLHESRVVMTGIVGVLTSLFVFSKNSTKVKLYADKVADAIGGVANKTFSASEDEE